MCIRDRADVLYGVSMEKAGVSKIISVKLDGQERVPGDKKELDEKKMKKERLEGFSTSEERQVPGEAEPVKENIKTVPGGGDEPDAEPSADPKDAIDE